MRDTTLINEYYPDFSFKGYRLKLSEINYRIECEDIMKARIYFYDVISKTLQNVNKCNMEFEKHIADYMKPIIRKVYGKNIAKIKIKSKLCEISYIYPSNTENKDDNDNKKDKNDIENANHTVFATFWYECYRFKVGIAVDKEMQIIQCFLQHSPQYPEDK